MIVIIATALSVLPIAPYCEEQSQKANASANFYCLPIYIDGNSEFTTRNGIVEGSGTYSDPYIIRGWNIGVPIAYGIWIKDTTAYFIIENCYIYDCAIGAGIFLENCTHGTIIENNCQGNNIGIYLYSSSNNTLSNNLCCSNSYAGALGICLDESHGNVIMSNNCSKNEYGIYLEASDENTIMGNNCSRNQFGIYLSSSSYNTLYDNKMYFNALRGIEVLYGSNLNSIWSNIFVNNNGSGNSYNSTNIQGFDDGDNNCWNSTDLGNFWSDWTSPNEIVSWEIIDNPYNLSGSAGAKDYYPLAYIPDYVAPATSVSISGAVEQNGWYDSDVNITFNATDSGSGVNRTEYFINVNRPLYIYNGTFSFGLEGINEITYWSYDNNGNRETNKTIRIRIDETAPMTTVSRIGNTVSFVASDHLSGVNRTYYRIDNNSWVETGYGYNSYSVYDLDNHTVEYYSIDNVGNSEDVKTFYVDNEANLIAIILFIAFAVMEAVFLLAFALIMRKQKNGGVGAPPSSS